MALIGMAVYDTHENGRSEFTERTLQSLLDTVDFEKHRLIVVDNASCRATQIIYKWLTNIMRECEESTGKRLDIEVIYLKENVGTANAINHAMRELKKGEYFIKLDNDVEFYNNGWVDDMEAAMRRMPKLGVLGLKRRDVCESTYAINPDQRSRLLEVPHAPGEKWFVVEQCKHVMGTCTMLSPELIQKVGYFYQMNGLYGFDDSLMCVRSAKAGYINAFFHGVDINHIDPGGTDYTKWKEEYAHKMITQYAEVERMYSNGTLSIYYDPFDENFLP
jgi:GT2 family glycosyltransferase